jgi:hypothetical protein
MQKAEKVLLTFSEVPINGDGDTNIVDSDSSDFFSPGIVEAFKIKNLGGRKNSWVCWLHGWR